MPPPTNARLELTDWWVAAARTPHPRLDSGYHTGPHDRSYAGYGNCGLETPRLGARPLAKCSRQAYIRPAGSSVGGGGMHST